jgi:uncharacterized protein (DUF362 family)
MSRGIRRREFLKTTAVLGAGLAVMGRGEARAEEAKGGKAVVVKVVRDDAVADKKVDAAVAKKMVHAAVCKLAGKEKPEEAWAVYVKKDDVVAIKINCLFGIGACTHPEVTAAVIEGCQMAGVPADKIIVWDNRSDKIKMCGYTLNKDAGVKFVGVDGAWEDEATPIHTAKGKLAKILTKECTALINVPILKTHSIAGMTQALKNHYGSFANPGDAHGDSCGPFLAELNALDPIRKKTRLIVSDALRPVADGGPQAHPEWTWDYKAILASTDPVAIDAVGLSILQAQRETLKKPPLKVNCLELAAKKGVGVADLGQIDIVTA